ncbi:MAG: ABC transporter ATP-binding protein/permease [Opitutales bacterium]|nr:ABC transporter ATP-binding protein/permease [Opitutales bacterium]
MFKRLRPYYALLLRVKWTFLLSILCGIVSGLASGFGLPLMIKKVLPVLFSESGVGAEDLVIFDAGSAEAVERGLDFLPSIVVPAAYLLVFAVMLLPLVFIIRGVCMFFNTYLLNVCGISVLEGIRMRLFSHLQDLHLGFFAKHNSGDLMSRTTGDTMLVKNAVVEVTNDLVLQPFTLAGAVGFVVWQAFQSGAALEFMLCLLLVPATVLPIRFVGKRIKKRAKQMLSKQGELTGILAESLQSPREVRSYCLEERECSRFQKFVHDFLKLQLKVVKYDKLLTPLIEMIAACTVSFAVYRAAVGGLQQDTVIALVGALYFAYDPIKKIGKVSNRLKESFAALQRLEEIIQTPIETLDPADPKPLGKVRGFVDFDKVCFEYDAGEPVLRDVSFKVSPGETVALVGPSGAGKSTVANLIPRFYDIFAGAVSIDGNDVRDVRLKELRSSIAMVSQEPVLFSDTIYNNVLLGRPDATRQEVIEALKRAAAYDFVMSLENGLETQVGERGGRLSGGQKQRLAIARAFLKNAPILILDEATSALDSESEAAIQSALGELVKGRTTFMIAHRFSSIAIATRILVFENGRIVGDGAHADVYKNCPLYKELYDCQTL